MKIAGKAPPVPEELETAEEQGFDYIELYLEKKHLDNLEDSLNNIRNSNLEVITAHTPHVPLNQKKYILKTDELVNRLDAYMVFHSGFLPPIQISRIEKELEIESDYGYENNQGSSPYHLKKMILDEGHEMVLDVAHLFMAGGEYLEETRNLISNYQHLINVIHLNDSLPRYDGLGFGEGDIDMERISKIICRECDFNGNIVLEVMPDHQREALEKFRSYIE